MSDEQTRIAEYDRYGGPEVVQIRRRPTPRPGPGQVLVRVRAAALNPKDLLARGGKFPLLAGRRFPKVMGYDWAGEAAAVGRGVEGVKVGDALFGMVQRWQGGTCADHVLSEADELAPRPPSLGWEEAAALPLASLTALQALRDRAGLGPGQRVLINGATGGVGAFAVQIARAMGAHVTAVTSAKNRPFALELGADEALDYEADDLRRPRAPYDVFFDVYGNRSFAFARPALGPRGTYVTTVPRPQILLDAARTLVGRGQRARLVVVRSRAADLRTLTDMVERGRLKPVIDRVFSLEQIVEAQGRLGTRHARGKVVVRVTGADA